MEIRKTYENMNYSKKGICRILINQWYLIKSGFSDLRLDWKFTFLVVLISPLSILFFMYYFFGDNSEYMMYAISPMR